MVYVVRRFIFFAVHFPLLYKVDLLTAIVMA